MQDMAEPVRSRGRPHPGHRCGLPHAVVPRCVGDGQVLARTDARPHPGQTARCAPPCRGMDRQSAVARPGFGPSARRYLAEAAYRFNRRFRLAELLPRLAPAMTLCKPWPEPKLRAVNNFHAERRR